MKNIIQFLRTMNREAALDSLRDVLAVIGLATLLGDFATMRMWYMVPAFALLCVVWYADYMRHDLPSPPLIEADNPELLSQIAELGR